MWNMLLVICGLKCCSQLHEPLLNEHPAKLAAFALNSELCEYLKQWHGNRHSINWSQRLFWRTKYFTCSHMCHPASVGPLVAFTLPVKVDVFASFFRALCSVQLAVTRNEEEGGRERGGGNLAIFCLWRWYQSKAILTYTVLEFCSVRKWVWS